VGTLWVKGGTGGLPGNGGNSGGGTTTPVPLSVIVAVIVAVNCETAKTGSGDGQVMVGGVRSGRTGVMKTVTAPSGGLANGPGEFPLSKSPPSMMCAVIVEPLNSAGTAVYLNV
jgi:hypothetical protein